MTDTDMNTEAAEYAERLEGYVTEALQSAEDDPEFDIWDREGDNDLPEAYGADIVIRIHTYGGGPAGGVEFDVDSDRRSFMTARTWHQDWFQPKGYAPLDNDTAEFLWDYWYLEGYLQEGM